MISNQSDPPLKAMYLFHKINIFLFVCGGAINLSPFNWIWSALIENRAAPKEKEGEEKKTLNSSPMCPK